MAYDADETRRRILAAATAEFAEHGLAGARVDRIAAAAACSKERLYAHYGDKESLFTAVLNASFAHLGEAASADFASVEDFAVAVFDHLVDNPANQRLLAWARLEQRHDWAASFGVLESVRATSVGHLERLVGASQAVDVTAATEGPDATAATAEAPPWSPDDLFALVLAIASAWVQLPGLPDDQPRTPDVEAQRAIVRVAVGRLLD
ncbi:TetR/AcrR family transcriptional regulator [Frigoribacterium sp. VKM Ac-2530]|uniref:TetR/AcrR family transcriptional regulator n=1 Tax=Frigoribacterium sp. VKM Ac-2530 TaxID=2783822 RepID=UPI00188D8DC3|nr:TetR family transcriptional regulator [Frigoribacterium sp. VKM Ac-2530]MBF4580620.1 TetR family transcriptional regulator [Frigoribacterium sp. VKM Ac-2530]